MKTLLIALLCLFSFGVASHRASAAEDIVLGVDRADIYGPLLTHKRVGLMVNQSSVNKEGRHTLDKLLSEQQRYHFTVTTLFSVEHGIRGNEDAGFGDDNHIDQQSGLPIVSLYGRDKDGRSRAHPGEAQLANVDVVIYDLQDVGVRFFTYTLSLHHMLESLQQYRKQLMVFDRPNPLGGAVYGPIMEQQNISGIGMHPVPMVHGLTSGEFARMIVGEGWLTHFDDSSWAAFGQPEWQFPPRDLHIIPMRHYTHDTPYSLPRRPSPNLRTDRAIRLYPSLGVFEATSVNPGRGSDYPFEQLGFPSNRFYVNTCYHVDQNQQKAGWPQAGKSVCGERLSGEKSAPTIRHFVTWWFKFHQAGLTLAVTPEQEARYLDYQESHFVIRPSWLAKVTGTRNLLPMMEYATAHGLSVDETVAMIEKAWQPGLDNWLTLRKKYQLYP